MVVPYEIFIDGKQTMVCVSDEPEALLSALADGRAVLGVGEDCAGKCPQVPVFVKDWDSLRPVTVERAARRKLGLPWNICKTRRLLVREAKEEDWEGMRAAAGAGDPAAAEKDSLFAFPDPEAFRAYIRHQYPFFEYGLWVLEDKKTGLLAGRAGLWNPGEVLCRRLEEAGERPEEYLELGYELFPAWRGRGLAEEACRAIMAYGDWELECKLCAQAEADNQASLRLLKKLGFWRLSEASAIPRRDSGETPPPYLYVWSC